MHLFVQSPSESPARPIVGHVCPLCTDTSVSRTTYLLIELMYCLIDAQITLYFKCIAVFFYRKGHTKYFHLIFHKTWRLKLALRVFFFKFANVYQVYHKITHKSLCFDGKTDKILPKLGHIWLAQIWILITKRMVMMELTAGMVMM